MINPVWGLLAKAQDNPQTIEQRIAEMIAQHEADPEAHMGPGESIENHRINNIIDHPQQSIVADKMSAGYSFVDIDTLTYFSGNISNCLFSFDSLFGYIYQDTSKTGQGDYLFFESEPYYLGFDSGDFISEFVISPLFISGNGEAEFNFSFGKVEFKYGYYRISYYNSGWISSSWIPASLDRNMVFRFFYSSVDSALLVYLNGVQVFSASYSLGFEFGAFSPIVRVNRGTSSYIKIGVGGFKYAFVNI